MNRKVADPEGTTRYSADASPRGVNCIHQHCGEAHAALRGWRPIPAALPRPIPSFFVLGLRRLPFHHQAQTPQNNRVSIRKTANSVNSIPLWKTHHSYRARKGADCGGGLLEGPRASYLIGGKRLTNGLARADECLMSNSATPSCSSLYPHQTAAYTVRACRPCRRGE